MSETSTKEWQPMPIAESQIAHLNPMVKKWLEEVRTLLPALPLDIEWIWDNNNLVLEQGIGGVCITPRLLHLSFDPDFVNKKQQLRNLRATVYHEAYHTLQGWSYFEGEYSSLQSAVRVALMEGLATAFERDYAGGDTSFSRPREEENMLEWYKEILQLPADYDDAKYRFYDPETGRRNIVYKVGLWLVDQILLDNLNPRLDTKDMYNLSPKQLQELVPDDLANQAHS